MQNSKLFFIVLATIVVTAVAVGTGSFWYFQRKQANSTATEQVSTSSSASGSTGIPIVSGDGASFATPTPASSSTPTPFPSATPDASWKTFTSTALGISFQYPPQVVVSTTGNLSPAVGTTNLSVTSQDLNTSAPGGFDKDNLARDQVALQKGDPTTPLGMGVPASFKVVKIPDALAKEFTILEQYEVCNVQFTHQMIIYHGSTALIFTSAANKDELSKNNAKYFKVDTANCGGSTVWSGQESNKFYQDLLAGQTDPQSLAWYKSLGSIIGTLKFNK